MFRAAELGRKIAKTEYKKRALVLREELLGLQQELRAQARMPVIVLFAGVDGAGKRETVNLLNEWMDPRWLVTRAYGEPSDEERERPEFWRFWRDLPPKGQIGLFLSAWYSKPILDRVYDAIDAAEFDKRIDHIVAFEKMLANDGAVILKFWMHLSRAAQKRRLKSLEKDPLLSWRIKEKDWENWRRYDQFIATAERAIMLTSTAYAPVHIIEGVDPCYRSLAVGTLVRDTIRERLDEIVLQDKLKAELKARHAVGDGPDSAEPLASVTESSNIRLNNSKEHLLTVLSTLDMTQKLGKKAYTDKLKALQARLNLLHRQALEHGISTLLVFEGPDAAGKGGAIKRVTASIDARNYRVIPMAAPTDEERAQHYLWRFWRHLSRAGRFTLFDRSWYGRVLVERVEGFASHEEWQRAYTEINEFESQLVEYGIVLLKFWIHVTKDEQLTRFKQREQIPYKRWKLTEEDWRNREKWDDYELAVNDMVERTSTQVAPWILVEGNSKRFARIKVLKTLCEKLEAALKTARTARKSA